MLLLLACPPAMAQKPSQEKSGAEMVTPAAEKAIERGLAILVSHQREDGSFGSANLRGNAAITALAGMALMSSGSTPGRGRYGEEVNRTVDYLMSRCQASGFIVEPGAVSHGPMYGHGFATLFLAECYGMAPRPELREKLDAAVKLIVNTQNSEGGWRYQPRREDADVSVTICEVMALRAARNAGLHVPKETIDRCTEYVKRCQNPDGGFMYTLQGREPSEFPRSAAGVVALQSAGIYEGPEITKGMDYLMKFLPREKATPESPHYHYGQYYAAVAMWQAGGDYWAKWYPAARDDLLARASPDGSWQSPYTVDYATAMALIVLEMPNNYLPIFQR
jgi:prenyltransferase beta subunit